MSTNRPELSIHPEGSVTHRKLHPALWALTISAFAIGTTEFVAVGILPTIAESMGVSVAASGSLISVYALGVAIGGPLLTVLTGKLPRKPLLIYLMLLFIAGHIVTAVSTGFTMLLLARFITGFAHATFFGVGSTIAASVVSPDRKASAIAIMFAGLTIAIIAGVPLGTFIGQHFGWRATFLGVALLGAVGCLAVFVLVPVGIRTPTPLRLKDQLKVLTNAPILTVLAITALGYGGTFVPFTFMATLLEKVSGFAPGYIGGLLLIYGLAIALGNIVGGRLSNTNPSGILIRLFLLQAIILLIFYFALPHKIPAIITLFFMGGLSFATVPGLQLYVVQLAEKYLPGTEEIAASLNIAAFNMGVAIGAWMGGWVLTNNNLGLASTPWVGAIIVFLGALLTIYRSAKEK